MFLYHMHLACSISVYCEFKLATPLLCNDLYDHLLEFDGTKLSIFIRDVAIYSCLVRQKLSAEGAKPS